MEAIELLIENQRVDLLKGIHEKISYTLSASDFGKLTQKHADIVQEFEVPYTSNNLGIFDFIAVAGYDCEFYKRKLKADLFFQGFPLIVDGWCRVLKCNEKTINICIYSRTENLHDSLGNKKITDLNFSDFNHPKNLEEFYKKFNTTDRSSYVYALANFQKVDFGEFESGVKEYMQRANEEDDRYKKERIKRKGKSQAAIDLANSGFFLATAASGVKNASSKVDIQFQLPSVYVSALWKKIFKEAGYFTYEGDIFQNSDFLEEVIPPSQFKYEVEGKLMDTASQRSLIGCFEVKNVDDYRSGELRLEKTTADCSIKQKDRGLLECYFSEYVNIEYDGLLIPKMELRVTRNKYVNPHINHTHIIFLKFENAGQYARKTASDFYRYALHLNDRSGVEERNNIEVSYDEHEQTVEAPEMNVKRGNVIVVLQELLAENHFYGEHMGFFDDVRSDVKGKIKFYSVDESEAGSGYVRFENILPDIKQIDFINDIIQRYGLVFQYDKSRKKHLKFAYLKDILRKKKGTEDWTEKFVRLESEDYIIDSRYCQNNYMKYKYVENYVNTNKNLIKRKKLEHDYDGNIEIPHEVLNFSNNLWTSPYTIGKIVGAISLQAIQTFRNTDRFTVLGEPFFTGNLELRDIENRLSIPIYEKTALQSYKFAKTNPYICYVIYDENEYGTTICYGSKIGEDFRYVNYLARGRFKYQRFIDHYYNEFTEVLRRSKKVTMWMKLDVVDVWNLDFFKLKYINQRGRFFYLNKVLNFNGTGFTKCEFLELPLSFSGVYVQPDIDTSVKFSLREQISKSIYPEIVFDEHFYINEFTLGRPSSTSSASSTSSTPKTTSSTSKPKPKPERPYAVGHPDFYTFNKGGTKTFDVTENDENYKGLNCFVIINNIKDGFGTLTQNGNRFTVRHCGDSKQTHGYFVYRLIDGSDIDESDLVSRGIMVHCNLKQKKPLIANDVTVTIKGIKVSSKDLDVSCYDYDYRNDFRFSVRNSHSIWTIGFYDLVVIKKYDCQCTVTQDYQYNDSGNVFVIKTFDTSIFKKKSSKNILCRIYYKYRLKSDHSIESNPEYITIYYDNTENVSNNTINSIEDTKNSIEDTKNSIENTKNSIEDTKNSIEDTKNSIEDTKNSIEDTKNSIEDTKNSIEDTKNSIEDETFYFQFESYKKAANKDNDYRYDEFVLEGSNFKEGIAFSRYFPYESVGSEAEKMICCFKEGDKFESWARYHFRDKQNPNDRTNSATMYFHVDVARVGSRTEAGAKRSQEEAKKAYGYGILDYESGGEEGAMTYPAGSEHRKSYEAGLQAAREGIVGSSFSEAVSTTSPTKEEAAYELSEKTSITSEQAERDRKAREQAERDRKARERREQAERDRKAREAKKKEAYEDGKADCAADKARERREQAERDRKAREQAERERKAREAKKKEAYEDGKADCAADKARERREQAEREQAERDRKAREQAEKDRKAREQAERDRKAREQAERDREAREQAERDRKRGNKLRKTEAREQAERDRKAREQAENFRQESEGRKLRDDRIPKRGNKKI